VWSGTSSKLGDATPDCSHSHGEGIFRQLPQRLFLIFSCATPRGKWTKSRHGPTEIGEVVEDFLKPSKNYRLYWDMIHEQHAEGAAGLTSSSAIGWGAFPDRKRRAFSTKPGKEPFFSQKLAEIGGLHACQFIVRILGTDEETRRRL
jgi:hypothetical protein